MPDEMTITYRARNGRPPVDLDLHLDPDGQVRVFIGTSYSIPGLLLNRVGTFAGPAPDETLASLSAYLREHDLLARGGSTGQAAPSTPGRFLEVETGGRQAQFKLVGMTSGPEIDPFEKLLQGLAGAMTARPEGAVEACLHLRRVEQQLSATIELRSIGPQPMDALLVDPANPLYALFAQVELRGLQTMPNGVTIPRVLGAAVLAPDTLSAMLESGALPAGSTRLPPGASYRFALPPLDVPAEAHQVTATGRLEFWVAEGKARRSLVVSTPETPIPG